MINENINTQNKILIALLKWSFVFTFSAIPIMTVSGVSLSDKLLIIVFCYFTLLLKIKILLKLPVTYVYGLTTFVLFAFIGVVVADSTLIAYAYVANYLVQIILFICFVILFYNSKIQRIEILEFIYKIGLINAIVAIVEQRYFFEIQRFLILFRQKNYLYGRSSGLFDNPNHLGIFLSIVFIIGIYFLLVNKNKFLIFGNIIIFLGIIVSGSRSAFIGFMLGNLLLLYYLNKYKIKKINIRMVPFFFVSLIVGVILVSMNQFSRIKLMAIALFEGNFELATGYRATIWINAIELFKENWLLGIGNGNFQESIVTLLGESRGIHSLYFSLLVENGIVGVVLFMSFIMITWKNSRFITNKHELVLFKTLLPTLLVTQITEMQLYNVFQFVFIFWMVLSTPYSHKLIYTTKKIRSNKTNKGDGI